MPAWCIRGRTFPQFDGHVLASRNCAVSVARSLVHFGGRGRVKPTAQQIRARMGTRDWATPLDVKKAVESYDSEMRRRGLKPLRYKLAGTMAGDLYVKGATREALKSAVKRLEMVHVVVDYGVVNDISPALSGSTSFRSRHAIWIGGGNERRPGWRKRGGRLEVRVSDSTWGRVGTPKASPKWVPFGKVWKWADGAWSSRGGRGWVGGSVACSPKLKTQQPEPPEDPCEDPIAELQERLDDALEQLGEAQALIDELRTKRLPRALVDRLVALTEEIDAATPVIDDDAPVESGMATPEPDDDPDAEIDDGSSIDPADMEDA